MKIITVFISIMLTTLTGIGLAAEGTVEIYQPTTISTSGVYTVVQNLMPFGGDAIVVNADDVTIDLMGHTVSAGSFFVSPTAAIVQGTGFQNLTVRNGTLIGTTGAGLFARGKGTRVIGISVRKSDAGGLLLGSDAVVRDCAIATNTLTSAERLVEVGDRANLQNILIADNRGDTLVGVYSGDDCRMRGIRILNNHAEFGYFYGIWAGKRAIIDGVQVISNTGKLGQSYGIRTGEQGHLDRCQVIDLSVVFSLHAFESGTYSRILRCSAIDLETNSGESKGFAVGSHAVVQDCIVGNAIGSPATGFALSTNVIISSCVATDTGYVGFLAPYGGRITDCVARKQDQYGFYLVDYCHIERVLADNNGGNVASDAGIYVSGRRNTVQNTHVSDNGRGIFVPGSSNLIIGNSGWNSTNFVITGSSNKYGTLQDSPGENFSTTSPWHNFKMN